jgi:hypothetical protein
MKKTLEQIQAEFHQDAETLATLQGIYAERVKQIRTNRAFPPDIQQRFLLEWEQFYDQRVKEIFSQDMPNHSPKGENGAANPTNNPNNEAPEKTDKRPKR